MSYGDFSSVISTLNLGEQAYSDQVVRIKDDLYCAVYSVPGNVLKLRSLRLALDGTITSLNTLSIASVPLMGLKAFLVSGSIIGIVSRLGVDGVITTYSIADDGTITAIGSYVFTSAGESMFIRSDVLKVGAGIFAFCYQSSTQMRLRTVSVSTDGAAIANVDMVGDGLGQNVGVYFEKIAPNIYVTFRSSLVILPRLYTWNISAAGAITLLQTFIFEGNEGNGNIFGCPVNGTEAFVNLFVTYFAYASLTVRARVFRLTKDGLSCQVIQQSDSLFPDAFSMYQPISFFQSNPGLIIAGFGNGQAAGHGGVESLIFNEDGTFNRFQNRLTLDGGATSYTIVTQRSKGRKRYYFSLYSGNGSVQGSIKSYTIDELFNGLAYVPRVRSL